MPLTDKQKQAIEALEQHGGVRPAARAIGIEPQTLRGHLKAAQKYLDADPGVQAALDITGISGANATGGWRKIKDPETGSFASVQFRLPKDDPADKARQWAEIFRGALADVPRAPPAPPPENPPADILPRYIVTDVHFGMQAWAREAGEHYDLKVATSRYAEATSTLLDATPPSERAIILNLGDTLHNNDQSNATPTSNHTLDVDSRFGKIAYEAVKAQVLHIEAARQKHQHVEVIPLAGNHDPDAAQMMAIALQLRFEGDPRVTVRFHPCKLWAMQFGRVLLAAHHGDKTKPERLAMQVADDYSTIWGQTHWRYLDTGHIHHDHGRDIGGIYWQAHRSIVGRDAHAAAMGYTSRKTMKAITVHRERGEILRNTAGIG